MKRVALTIIVILSNLLFIYSQEKKRSKTDTENLQILKYRKKVLYWQAINTDSAIYYSKIYLFVSKNEKSIEDIINGTLLLANFLHAQSKFSDEIIVRNTALKYLKAKQYEIVRADMLYAMGDAARAIRQFNIGMTYLKEAESIYQSNNALLKLAKTYNRKAAILFKLLFVDFTEAFENADKSIIIADKLGDYELVASNLEIKGAIYDYLKDYKKALIYFAQVLEIFETNNISPDPNILINICITSYKIKNHVKAIKYGEKAYELTKKHGSDPQLETVSDFLSYAYAAVGNYSKAYEYLRISNGIRIRLFDEKKDAKITELSKKYQSEKNKLEIEKQQEIIKNKDLELRNKQTQNIVLLMGFLFSVIIIFIVYLQSRTTKKLNNQLTNKNKEIKHQSQELSFKNNKLIQLGRFKESMTSMLVHDLKNPINVIIGNANDYKNNKTALHVNDAASKMLVLVLNLLDVEKYETTTMKISNSQFQIQALIDNIYQQIKYSLEIKNIRFQLNITNNYTLYADMSIIERVLVNLLTNAIKFTPQNGKITINATPINEKQMSISVADSGSGINHNLHKRIFEKYSQIGNEYQTQASGLGLAFCKIAVERHGGSIYLQKNRKEGAEFIFSIPYIAEENTKFVYQTIKNKQLANEANEKIVVNSDEKKRLTPFVLELKELDVSCITDVKNILNDIDLLKIKSAKEISKKINLSLESCNQNMYDSILEELLITESGV